MGLAAFILGKASALAAEEVIRYHTDALRYEVYSDTPSKTIQLAYFDNEGNTPTWGQVRSETTNDTTVVNKGKASLKMTFHMPAGDQYYSGWFFLRSEGTVDISDKSKVEFNLKSTPGITPPMVQVGIRSINVNSNTNRAKVFLSDLGIEKMPTQEFAHIEIPTSILLDREPDLDLSHIKETFIIGIVGPDRPIEGESLWIDGLTWDWGFVRVAGGLKGTIGSNVLFDFDKWNLRPDALVVLKQVVGILQDYKDRHLRVEGHCDIRGSDAYNRVLSRKRAKSVADYIIIKEGGFSPSQIKAAGFGWHRPIAPNDTEENMQKNRRVEIIIEDKE